MSNTTYALLLLALLAGMMMPTQAMVNGKMAAFVGSPISAALISFVVGTAALLVYVVVFGGPFATLLSAREAPPVAWVGGLLGAFFVVIAATLVPRIGAAMTFSLMIAGQMIATLTIDHFGLLGVPAKSVSLARIGGILLIMAGVVLIRRF